MGAAWCLNVTTRKAKEHLIAVALKLGRKEGVLVCIIIVVVIIASRGREREREEEKG